MSPDARAVFLNSTCGGDAELRGEVERLLTDAEKAEAFFGDQPTLANHPVASVEVSQEKPGDSVGPYRLIERIGEGGFGIVWLAEQATPIRRRVAMKVLKAGLDTAEVLARFQAEREALSRMEHPHIARVFDAGETSRGRPFFVMEFVEGRAITEYCDAGRRTLRDRLQLFLGVCSAVSHAHQKGVIHRDLKPSNILVTDGPDGPLVKVIDFGIAKAVQGRLADVTLVTIAPLGLGTPAYMSPEQLAGRDVDTRTDVYSLGVVLYELLVGVPPFDPKALLVGGVDELRRTVLESEPLRPSLRFRKLPQEVRAEIAAARVLTSETLPVSLTKELDWVAVKALEKDRDRRYASADAFAADVERFLTQQPVTARAPTPAYLLSTFARRHRTGLFIAGLLAAILVTATVVSALLAIRASHAEAEARRLLAESQRAESEKARALQNSESVSGLLVDVFRLPDPEKNSRNITLAEALQKANAKLDALPADQPERKAFLKAVLADTQMNLGAYPEATELYKEALALSTQATGEDSPQSLGILTRLANLLNARGYYSEALTASRRLVELRTRSGTADPRTMEALQQQIESLLVSTGAKPRPTPTRINRPEPSGPPPTDEERHERARQRIVSLEAELEASRVNTGPDSADTIQVLRKLADTYYGSGRGQEAIRVQRDLVDILERKYGPTHFITIQDKETLAFFNWRSGGWRDAIRLQEELSEARKRIFGPDHADTLASESRLLERLYISKVPDRALRIGEDLVPRMDRVLGKENRSTAHARSFLGRALLHFGRTQEGLAELQQCGPWMNDDTLVNMMLGGLEVWFGKTEAYSRTRQRMLAYAVANCDNMPTRPDIAERAVLTALLTPVEVPAQIDGARKVLARCAVTRSAKNAPELRNSSPHWTRFMNGLVEYRDGNFTDALRIFDQALAESGEAEISNKQPGIHILRAACLLKIGDPTAARAAYDLARQSLNLPEDDAEPYKGRNAFDGPDIVNWLLLREVRPLFDSLPGTATPSVKSNTAPEPLSEADGDHQPGNVIASWDFSQAKRLSSSLIIPGVGKAPVNLMGQNAAWAEVVDDPAAPGRRAVRFSGSPDQRLASSRQFELAEGQNFKIEMDINPSDANDSNRRLVRFANCFELRLRTEKGGIEFIIWRAHQESAVVMASVDFNAWNKVVAEYREDALELTINGKSVRKPLPEDMKMQAGLAQLLTAHASEGRSFAGSIGCLRWSSEPEPDPVSSRRRYEATQRAENPSQPVLPQ